MKYSLKGNLLPLRLHYFSLCGAGSYMYVILLRSLLNSFLKILRDCVYGGRTIGGARERRERDTKAPLSIKFPAAPSHMVVKPQADRTSSMAKFYILAAEL